MGSQLRWLERTPDKREVDGSIPFEPTIDRLNKSLSKHIEKYIDKLMKGKLAYESMQTIKPKESELNREIKLFRLIAKRNKQCKENEQNRMRQYDVHRVRFQ